LAELTALPRPSSWIWGRKEWKRWKGKGIGRKGETREGKEMDRKGRERES